MDPKTPETFPIPSDEVVLRRALEQVLEADISVEHGWREGTAWLKRSGPVAAALVARGILVKQRDTFYLSEAAVIRALQVAVEAALTDLLTNNPPHAEMPFDVAEDENDDPAYQKKRLILRGGVPSAR